MHSFRDRKIGKSCDSGFRKAPPLEGGNKVQAVSTQGPVHSRFAFPRARNTGLSCACGSANICPRISGDFPGMFLGNPPHKAQKQPQPYGASWSSQMLQWATQATDSLGEYDHGMPKAQRNPQATFESALLVEDVPLKHVQGPPPSSLTKIDSEPFPKQPLDEQHHLPFQRHGPQEQEEEQRMHCKKPPLRLTKGRSPAKGASEARSSFLGRSALQDDRPQICDAVCTTSVKKAAISISDSSLVPNIST